MISRKESRGVSISSDELIKIMNDFKEQDLDSIDLVSPTQYCHLLIPLLKEFKKNNDIPVIWNSNAYEKREMIKALDGCVDVFLPDLKFYSTELSERLCSRKDYFEIAITAIDEMLKLVPENIYDDKGLLKKGLIIRHLILPNHTSDSIRLLKEIKNNFGPKTIISLMSQYIPEGRAGDFDDINRRLKRKEYQWVIDSAVKMGFENIYLQDFASASESFIPDFQKIN